jgi:hypothetical protein
MIMVLLFAFHNICEVLIFWEFLSGIKADYLLRMYYAISIASLLSISWYVASLVSIRDSLQIRVTSATCLVFIVLLMTTDLIITGSTPISYIVTASRGQFYWAFQLLCLGLLFTIVTQLYVTYSKADSHITEIRSVYTALALMPTFMLIIIIIIMMNFGVHVNGAALFPIATTLFLVVTLASEYQHKLTDVRRFLPFSDERRTSNEILEIFSNYARDESNYRDSVSKIERLLVLHKLNKADGNASLTAEQMGMPRSSLYSIFNRLKIKVRE